MHDGKESVLTCGTGLDGKAIEDKITALVKGQQIGDATKAS